MRGLDFYESSKCYRIHENSMQRVFYNVRTWLYESSTPIWYSHHENSMRCVFCNEMACYFNDNYMWCVLWYIRFEVYF